MGARPRHEIVIQANRNWFFIDWRELLSYRDLLFLFVRRDFLAKYKQTVLGPAWFILQPLLTSLVFVIVFHKGLRISTDGVPPILFYLSGLVAWSYLSRCVTGVSTCLTANGGLLQKVYFPRLILPFSLVLSSLITFGVQLVTFLAFYLYFKLFTPVGSSIEPHLVILALPFFTLQVMATGLGVGLWVAALTVRYRDLQYFMSFLTQIWMYATPIIYPSSAVPEFWRSLMTLNPMASIVEFYRIAFFGVGRANTVQWIVSLSLSGLLLLTGALAFNRAERTFVDTI